MNETLSTALAKQLVAANAVRGASIVGRGGWSVLVKVGMVERPLTAQRSGAVRVWRSLDTCVDYLKGELGIARIDEVDARQHERDAGGRKRPDRAEALRQAHAAAEHDKWFREQVELAIAEADDPNAVWIPNEQVMAEAAAQRARILARVQQQEAATVE